MVGGVYEIGIVFAQPLIRAIHKDSFCAGLLKREGCRDPKISDGARDNSDLAGELIGRFGHGDLIVQVTCFCKFKGWAGVKFLARKDFHIVGLSAYWIYGVILVWKWTCVMKESFGRLARSNN